MEKQRQKYFPELEVLGLKIGDGKKKVFVQDKTTGKPLAKKVPLPEPVVEPKPVPKSELTPTEIVITVGELY